MGIVQLRLNETRTKNGHSSVVDSRSIRFTAANGGYGLTFGRVSVAVKIDSSIQIWAYRLIG